MTSLDDIIEQRKKTSKLYLKARGIRLEAAREEEVLKEMTKQYCKETNNGA